MKNIWLKLWMIPACVLTMACSKDIDVPYSEGDRIYFEYLYQDPNYAAKRLIVRDSLEVSMGLLPDEVKSFEVKIPVLILGNPLLADKHYRVEAVEKGTVVKGTTTAKVNEDYMSLPETYTFHANTWTDTLRVVLLRSHLSPSFTLKQQKSLILRLVETEELKPGIREGHEVKISMNNYVAQPKWWNVYALGYYHPQKYRILLMFNTEEFYSKVNILNDADRYINALKGYLKDNVVIDQETGKRVGFDNLIDMDGE
ncbi:DUF4843 domain-containing protein [Segatella baroniae]|nr:DUF4843 domain-containing protein [Segatella baroniae]